MIKLKDILFEDIIENASVVDTLLQALPHIKKLGNKPMLIRESGGIRSGAAKITSGPWDKGKIGSVINPASSVYDADLGKLFNNLVAKFSINHIVYAAYESNRHGLFGSEYFLIPTSDYKTVWSPEIRDIYSDASTMQKQGTLNAFPMHSYKNEWPTGKVDEVLVDCNEYYLITTRIPIIQDYMKYTAYKQGNPVVQPTTYEQLTDIIEHVLHKYKPKYDASNINKIEGIGPQNFIDMYLDWLAELLHDLEDSDDIEGIARYDTLLNARFALEDANSTEIIQYLQRKYGNDVDRIILKIISDTTKYDASGIDTPGDPNM